MEPEVWECSGLPGCCVPEGADVRVEIYGAASPLDGIYLDHAATTPVDPEVVAAMRPYLGDQFGNPSSIHSFGRSVRASIDTARDTVAHCLGAGWDEILFTGGGTESDNTVLQGVVVANRDRGNHIITSAIEHHAILDTCEFLEEVRGTRVTLLPVDQHGLVDPDDVRRALTDQTVLVSVMHANNEIGTVQPVAEIGRVCREAGVLFHTDAVQSVGSLPVDVEALNVDFLSLSAHKFYGPKGVGVLYARDGARWRRLLHGGSQERKRRAGTENVAGIMGLARALELADGKRDAEEGRLRGLRDGLIDGVLSRVERCRLNGHPTCRLPNSAHFSVEGVEGEALLMNLDMMGIAASTGSACTSGSLEPSHVLKAIGVPAEAARCSIRFTLGRSTSEEVVEYVAQTFAEIVVALRSLTGHAG